MSAEEHMLFLHALIESKCEAEYSAYVAAALPDTATFYDQVAAIDKSERRLDWAALAYRRIRDHVMQENGFKPELLKAIDDEIMPDHPVVEPDQVLEEEDDASELRKATDQDIAPDRPVDEPDANALELNRMLTSDDCKTPPRKMAPHTSPIKFSCAIKQNDINDFFGRSPKLGKFAKRESMAIFRKSPSAFTPDHYEWIQMEHDAAHGNSFPWLVAGKEWFKTLLDKGVEEGKITSYHTVSGARSIVVRSSHKKMSEYMDKIKDEPKDNGDAN
jgi:hypothetical protein